MPDLQARRILGSLGVTPRGLARRQRPVTFVDVVYRGSTFTELFDLLRTWIDGEREPWPVIRRKVRYRTPAASQWRRRHRTC